jgi:hypothetical protein
MAQPITKKQRPEYKYTYPHGYISQKPCLNSWGINQVKGPYGKPYLLAAVGQIEKREAPVFPPGPPFTS